MSDIRRNSQRDREEVRHSKAVAEALKRVLPRDARYVLMMSRHKDVRQHGVTSCSNLLADDQLVLLRLGADTMKGLADNERAAVPSSNPAKELRLIVSAGDTEGSKVHDLPELPTIAGPANEWSDQEMGAHVMALSEGIERDLPKGMWYLLVLAREDPRGRSGGTWWGNLDAEDIYQWFMLAADTRGAVVDYERTLFAFPDTK